MKLSKHQIDEYSTAGVLVIPDLLAEIQVTKLMEEAIAMTNTDGPERIVEKTGEPNSVYITDKYPALFGITVSPQLLTPAKQLLGGDVYLHQAKVNPKAALNGSFVAWHRDFEFWHELDGMPMPKAVTAAVILEDVDAYNAPLLFVPGSHRHERDCPVVRSPTNADDDDADGAPVGSWANARLSGQSTVLGELKYVVDDADVEEPFIAFTGRRGSAAFFDSNVVHGSTHNMAPRDRHILFITYNSVDNALRPVNRPRPPFIANRDFSPLRARSIDGR
jgi:ectoine hydroxylase